MPRTFAYLRVSTTGQTTDNQLQEIKAAGFKVEPRCVVTETISGNVATSQRRGFTRLLDRLEPADVLVVTKLDRLGRNVMDVGSTVARLADRSRSPAGDVWSRNAPACAPRARLSGLPRSRVGRPPPHRCRSGRGRAAAPLSAPCG